MADKYIVEEAEALAKRALVQFFPQLYTCLTSRTLS
jgi:hypothetical protein